MRKFWTHKAAIKGEKKNWGVEKLHEKEQQFEIVMFGKEI